MKKYLAEGFGTMFLVLLACGSAVLAGPSIGGYGIGVCFGLVLICLCYCIGNISGCHVNPAVSFAMWLAGKMSAKDFVGYVVAQLIGATIGAGFLYWFVDMSPEFNFGGITGDNNLATNVLQPGASSAAPAGAVVRTSLSSGKPAARFTQTRVRPESSSFFSKSVAPPIEGSIMVMAAAPA